MFSSLQCKISIWIVIPALVQVVAFYIFFAFYVFPRLQGIEERGVSDSSSRAHASIISDMEGLSRMTSFLATDAAGRDKEAWTLLVESLNLASAPIIEASNLEGQPFYTRPGGGSCPVDLSNDSDISCGLLDNESRHLIACIARVYDKDHKLTGSLLLGRHLLLSLAGSISLAVYQEQSEEGQRISKMLQHPRAWNTEVASRSIVETFRVNELGSTNQKIMEVKYPRSIGIEVHALFVAVSLFLVIILIMTMGAIHHLIRSFAVVPLYNLSEDVDQMASDSAKRISLKEYPKELHLVISEIYCIGWKGNHLSLKEQIVHTS